VALLVRYRYPPLLHLRTNPLKTVEYHDKVRPFLNLSHPILPIVSSFNEALL
jgi:hypothetical protein